MTALDTTAAETPPDGKQVFKDRCALCHTVRKLAPELCEKLPAQRRDFLERYLASHHAPDPAERKAVRDYLDECCD
ncbi:MAG: hypothetical protein HXY26_03070 [Hydrogenophilaceae bacterium]|nr:hypothetical protein [Hydrogenophilaceae bacterium]